MTKKEEKIKRLWGRDIKDPAIIAKKLGYSGNALTAAIKEIKEIIINLKLH